MPASSSPSAPGIPVPPPIANAPIVNAQGFLTPVGLNFFQLLWSAVFGQGGTASQIASPGDVKMVASPTAPMGWLVCDGSSVAVDQYPALYEAIGVTWGSAGPGFFNLPPLQDKLPLGAGGTHAVGDTGGAMEHTIAQANLPNYTLPNTLGFAQDTGTSNKNGVNSGAVPSNVAAGSDLSVYTSDEFASPAITVTGHVTGSVESGGSGTPLDTTPAFAALLIVIKT